MDGIINWVVDSIRGVILWQIATFTSDLDSMILFTAAFDVMVLTFTALLFFGGSKFRPVVQIMAVAMMLISIVTVALVR